VRHCIAKYSSANAEMLTTRDTYRPKHGVERKLYRVQLEREILLERLTRREGAVSFEHETSLDACHAKRQVQSQHLDFGSRVPKFGSAGPKSSFSAEEFVLFASLWNRTFVVLLDINLAC
jgi:hypothetical protein